MAVVIRHGPNGSYKSASALWHDLLPALRQGRICVTNLEGIYSLPEIEKRLGEKFPDTARLFRISSLHDHSLKLWRRWFHWMPCGAFVLIDEIQDVYPEGAWKEKDLDRQPIETYKKYLPEGFIELFYEVLNSYKPTQFDDADTDDTGQLLFNEDGCIIYPTTLNGAFKRHRKFNWDIVCCTPDITDVSKIVRGCAELAKAQANKDSFIFFKRKPRIYEHNPKTNGIPNSRDAVYRQKVPLAVFSLYKSTQTGKHTKSGQSLGPFKSPVFIFYGILLLVFLLWFLYDLSASRSHSPAVSDKAGASISVDGAKAVTPISSGGGRHAPVNGGNSLSGHNDVFLSPMDATQIYVTGDSLDRQGNGVILLSLTTKEGEFHTNNEELFAMGYAVTFIGHCQAKLVQIDNGASKGIYCRPKLYEPPQQRDTGVPSMNPFQTITEGAQPSSDPSRERDDQQASVSPITSYIGDTRIAHNVHGIMLSTRAPAIIPQGQGAPALAGCVT